MLFIARSQNFAIHRFFTVLLTTLLYVINILTIDLMEGDFNKETTMKSKLPKRNTALIVAVITSASFIIPVTSSNAIAATYPGWLENSLVSVCHAIRKDDTRALKNAVRDSRVSLKVLHEGLVCNGEDMMSFAERHRAMDTSELIARRLKLQDETLTARR